MTWGDWGGYAKGCHLARRVCFVTLYGSVQTVYVYLCCVMHSSPKGMVISICVPDEIEAVVPVRIIPGHQQPYASARAGRTARRFGGQKQAFIQPNFMTLKLDKIQSDSWSIRCPYTGDRYRLKSDASGGRSTTSKIDLQWAPHSGQEQLHFRPVTPWAERALAQVEKGSLAFERVDPLLDRAPYQKYTISNDERSQIAHYKVLMMVKIQPARLARWDACRTMRRWCE